MTPFTTRPFFTCGVAAVMVSNVNWICPPIRSVSAWAAPWPLSPAFLILWAPGGFRLTCYYYRKAYYRSIWLDPVACAVGLATLDILVRENMIERVKELLKYGEQTLSEIAWDLH